MLSMMLSKLKSLKGKTEAKGRMYLTQQKFRNPTELDFKHHTYTIIEDLANGGKRVFFVFDMAGRLDPRTREENRPFWVVGLPT
ncbi:hypothetical protein OESDEN_13946 [Oesophagostomum dentatum]|uniref:Uncharacterized protein n=1 Tax=Oesophagostomum dentatum TaxID=61180 RepID=A0A0B1SLV5_OESDE|nr:hypothetical protein OESDEN_13946 [Oesophagostomum dentatum]